MARNFLQAIVFVVFLVNTELTFGELEAFPGLGLAVFFAFHNARVAGQETSGFQSTAQAGFI